MSDSFDRLLARSEHRNTAPPDQCPDADVLAAYVDATLARSERAALEAHAADCSRCALQLGTMVRLEDESGHPQHTPRRGWSQFTWMVPAATAVLVAAVYVARPSDVPPPPNAPALSERVAAAPPDAAVAGAEVDRAATPPTGLEPRRAPLPARKAGPPSLKTAPVVVERAPMDMGRPLEKREEPVLEQDQFADRTPAADAPASSAPTPAALARQSARTNASAAASSMLSVSPRLLVVRSPDGRVLWRVTGTRIERSADGGSTWMTEHGRPAAQVTAGAAPSGHVCWLATESGQVLRRNEAGSWRDVSPTPYAAIARIESTSVLEATVVHTDGTTLTTADGGRTWTH